MTEVGKYLRKLRIDREERGKDMAAALGVSPQYLSMIESGKRRMSDNLASVLIAAYDFDEEEIIRFYNAIALSYQEIRLNLRRASSAKKELGLTLVRKFDSISDEDAIKITSILNEDMWEEKDDE